VTAAEYVDNDEVDEDEAQLWRCVELDDATVEELRRLLFCQHQHATVVKKS
jgi:hypothetical protein